MIKYLIAVFASAVIMVACSTPKGVLSESPNSEFTYGVSVIASYINRTDSFNITLIDSMIRADRLPQIGKWQGVTLKDHETNKTMLFKTLLDLTNNMIYSIKLILPNLYVVRKKNIK